MKVSIIIPSWNRKDNLLRTLTCLEKQDVSDDHKIEVIVVDDGSDDQTTYTLTQRTWDISLKIIYRNRHSSWNASIPRNMGARLTTIDTDALLFLDSDVMLPPDRVQKYIDDYMRNPQENRVIIGPYHYMQNAMQWYPEWYKNPITNYNEDVRWKSFLEHSVDDMYSSVGFALACFGGSLFIPRKLFFKAGGYDEKVTSGCEDGDFGLTLWETGAVFSVDRDLLGWHHPHTIVPSRTENIKEMVDYIDAKHKMDLVHETGSAMRAWGVDWVIPQEWLIGSGYKEEDFNAS